MSLDVPLDTLTDGVPQRVEVLGRRVCLVRAGEQVHAIDDTCSHAEASLSEGDVDDGEIECWLHGATFDLVTGEATALPATAPVAVHTTTVTDGIVTIKLST